MVDFSIHHFIQVDKCQVKEVCQQLGSCLYLLFTEFLKRHCKIKRGDHKLVHVHAQGPTIMNIITKITRTMCNHYCSLGVF